jgi:hypothetical protein
MDMAQGISFVVKEVRCPKCGAGEMHPNGQWLLVRGFKVCDKGGYWWSQCLVCAGYYNADLTLKPIGANGRDPDYDHELGWF